MLGALLLVEASMPPDPEEEPEMAHALKTGARTDDEPDAPELGGNPALVAYGEELACKMIQGMSVETVEQRIVSF